MYCVYLTIYRGKSLPPFYIGSTSVKKITQGYRGSVSSAKWGEAWKRELKENPNLFSTMIIPDQLSDSPVEILKLERKWQLAFDVVKNPLFINESYAVRGFCSTPESALKAAATRRRRGTDRRSPETIEKIRQKHIGSKRPPVKEETRKKISAAHKGRKHSPEHIAKIAASNTGKKMPPEFGQKVSDRFKGRKLSEEHKAKIIGTGRKYSEESKQRMSEAQKGSKKPRTKPMTEEHKEKIRQARLGTKRSPETCAKISQNKKGYIASEEARAKIRAANLGRSVSEDTRAKISAASCGRKLSDEHRQKLKDAKRRRRENLD
jgi:hypothetical protein